MSDQITDELVQKTIELGEFIVSFAKINRATHLDKAGTPESDTDHTVMLSVIACAFAQRFHPEYDLGKVAHYALVHDLVEVFAGDVVTIDHHSVDRKAKEKNEADALDKITKLFGATFPWISDTIQAYESLVDPEARFVKTMDKVMPAISQNISGNKTINESFDTPEAFEASMTAINDSMTETYAHDQELCMQLRLKVLEDVIEKTYQHHGAERKKS